MQRWVGKQANGRAGGRQRTSNVGNMPRRQQAQSGMASLLYSYSRSCACLHFGSIGTRRGGQPKHPELALLLAHTLHCLHHILVACSVVQGGKMGRRPGRADGAGEPGVGHNRICHTP